MFDLGLSDRTFWRLTPRQYWALIDRLNARDAVQDLRSAYMPWLYHQAHRGHGAELEIGAFMATARPKQKPRPSGAGVIARFRELAGR